MRLVSSVVVVCLVLGACVHPEPGPEGESHVVAFDHPTRWVPRFDVLFAIDTSAGMAPYRERIRELGPYLAGSLRAYTAGMPDVHIGIATTPDAPLAILTDVHNNDGSRATNFTGSLDDALTSALDVGSSGVAPPQPFDAIERAVANADFARDDASLLIVAISADDDHSLGAVSDYTASLAARDYDVLASGVYANPAPRLDAFHTALGTAWGPLAVPLDSTYYGRAFDPITNITIDFWEPCMDEPAGPPYECSISMIEGDVETVLPSCEVAPAEGPCWTLVVNPICFSETARQMSVDVRGYAFRYRPHTRGQCTI